MRSNIMDVAIVTGATTGIGLAVTKKLIKMGLRVYGLDPEAANCSWSHPEFFPVECDLFRQEKVALAWKEIIQRDSTVSVIVHAAEAKLEGALESAHPDDVRRALESRLMGPCLLTRYAIARLIRIRGTVIFINRRGDNAIASMVEGGIAAFADGLIKEVRDTGVKITQVALEPNSGDEHSDSRHTRIDPDTVAESVESVLRLPSQSLVTKLVVRPQATREEPFAAASTPLLRWGPDQVRLPEPENFPPEEELIPTPVRQRPADAPPPEEDDEDEYEDEDDELDRLMEESRQRLKNQVERQKQSDRDRQQQHSQNQGNRQERDGGNRQEGEAGNRRRRRRRGRRNRGRDRDHNQGGQQQEANRHEGEGEAQKPEQHPEPVQKVQESPKPQTQIAAETKERPAAKEPSKSDDDEAKPKKKAAKKVVNKTAKKATKRATKKAAKKAVKKDEGESKQTDPES